MVLSGLKVHVSLINISWKAIVKKSDEGYILEIDIQYPKKLQDFQTNLPVLAESMKIEKVKKLRAEFHDKKKCSSCKN